MARCPERRRLLGRILRCTRTGRKGAATCCAFWSLPASCWLSASSPSWCHGDRQRGWPDPGPAPGGHAQRATARAGVPVFRRGGIRTADLASAAEKLAGLDLMVAPVALRHFPRRAGRAGRGRQVSLLRERHRGSQSAHSGGRRARPLSHADHRRHRHGRRGRVRRSGPVTGCDGRRRRQRRVHDPGGDEAAACARARRPSQQRLAGSTTGPAPLPGWWKVGAPPTKPRRPPRSRPRPGPRTPWWHHPSGSLGDRLAALLAGPLAAARRRRPWTGCRWSRCRSRSRDG